MAEKLERIPKSALSLYVKLYCKRKGGTETKYYNNLIEATKSWLSLDEEEKQQFVDKLEDCRMKFKHRFADYLKNVEPYLKKKLKIRASVMHNLDDNTDAQNTSNTEPLETGSQNLVDTSGTVTDNLLQENLSKTIGEIDKICWMETFMKNAPQHWNPSKAQKNISAVGQNIDPMPEPLPPNIKSAKGLFNITKTIDNHNGSWETLSSQEKQRYRNAVLKLKKDYIFKYKAYLESLPSEKLFDYHNKAIES